MFGHIQIIQDETARAFGIPAHAMTSPRRARSWARPRQVAMYISKEIVAAASLPAIGRAFGNRDHTTVLHAIKTVSSLRAIDSTFDATIDKLTSRLRDEITRDVRDPHIILAAENLAREIGRHATSGLLALARKNPEAFVRRFLFAAGEEVLQQ